MAFGRVALADRQFGRLSLLLKQLLCQVSLLRRTLALLDLSLSLTEAHRCQFY